jgi:hypothetical protein
LCHLSPFLIFLDLVTTMSNEFQTTSAATEMPQPPPYTPPAGNFICSGHEDEVEQPTTNLVFHAPITVHGSGNAISIPPIDHGRLAATVLAALNQKTDSSSIHAVLPGNIVLQFNFGINVVGDRNVVGNSLRFPVSAPTAVATAQGIAQQRSQISEASVRPAATQIPVASSPKRKASEVNSCATDMNRESPADNDKEPENAPEAKRVERDSTAGSSPPSS